MSDLPKARQEGRLLEPAEREVPEREAARRPYATPILTELGSVEQVTEGIRAPGADNGSASF